MSGYDGTEISAFLAAAQLWICDGYSLIKRVFATRQGTGYIIFSADILFSGPQTSKIDNPFFCDEKIAIGSETLYSQPAFVLLEELEKALSGVVSLGDVTMHLESPHYRSTNIVGDND